MTGKLGLRVSIEGPAGALAELRGNAAARDIVMKAVAERIGVPGTGTHEHESPATPYQAIGDLESEWGSAVSEQLARMAQAGAVYLQGKTSRMGKL